MRVLIVTALITALIGGLCVGGALYSVSRGGLDGSGNVVSEERPVSGFTRVGIDGPGRLLIRQGQSEGLKITTDDNILERIKTKVEDDELRISYDRSTFTTLARIRPTDEIRFELTVKSLDAIEVDGTADVELDALQGDRLEIQVDGLGDATLLGLDLDELDVAINGASTFDVAGRVDLQTVDIDGAATYRAASLNSREAEIEIDGDGEATVRVRERLDVSIDGRGRVGYYGSPSVSQEIDGDGEVFPLDDATGSSEEASPAATPAATPSAARPASPTATTRALTPSAKPTRTPTPD